MANKYSISDLAKAIYTVNRHAKSALKPKQLYELKKAAISKLIEQKRVEKIGLQFSQNPQRSVQHSVLLVKIDDYYFHTLPEKDDFNHLKHLGDITLHHRNPKAHMSLRIAKQLLFDFLDWKEPTNKPQYSSYYTPS